MKCFSLFGRSGISAHGEDVTRWGGTTVSFAGMVVGLIIGDLSCLDTGISSGSWKTGGVNNDSCGGLATTVGLGVTFLRAGLTGSSTSHSGTASTAVSRGACMACPERTAVIV